MMERLFEMIAEAPSKMEFSIKASFLEIYNEKIRDLLDCNPITLRIFFFTHISLKIKSVKE